MFVGLFIFILVSFVISVSSFRNKLQPEGEYISKERTSMINGLFIWFVFLSHIGGYMDMPTGDVMLRDTVTFIGQCMVATFFFFLATA